MSDANLTPATLAHLPAMYQVAPPELPQSEEDNPLVALLHAYEAAIGGIDTTIDALATYFDPWTTPAVKITTRSPAARSLAPIEEPDFLSWLGTWVGVDLEEVDAADPAYADRKRRHLLKEAAVLYRHRGTVQGLKAMLEAFYDVQVDIEEWAWPLGMRVGVSSTLGVDTALFPEVDPTRSFVVVWKPPNEFRGILETGEWPLKVHSNAGSTLAHLRAVVINDRDWIDGGNWIGSEALRTKVYRIRNAIDRERPAHTICYLALTWGADARPEHISPTPMQIGVTSRIGACFLAEKGGLWTSRD